MNLRLLKTLKAHPKARRQITKRQIPILRRKRNQQRPSLAPVRRYLSLTSQLPVTPLPIAEYAAELLGADLYEIKAKQPYTEADLAYYTDGRCDKEQADPSVRPEIDGKVENMGQYDIILIGHPIWHGQAPRIISTFLESYDFADKTLVTFCTSASSGLGSSTTHHASRRFKTD